MTPGSKATASTNALVLFIIILLVAVGIYYFAQNGFPRTNPTPAPSESPTFSPSSAPSPASTPTASLSPTASTTIPSATPTPTTLPATTSPPPTPTSAPAPTPLAPMPFTPVSATNLNWGGYVVVSETKNPQPIVVGVSASWSVPTVVASQSDAFSSTWIGIGGFLDSSLIQTGTEQDSGGGETFYSAWYELLPADSVTIGSLTISPGDQMKASLSLTDPNTNQWLMSISDLTTNQSFQNTFVYNSSRSSADYVIERPDINKVISNLADFGTVSLSNCEATLSSQTGVINSFPSIRVTMYENIINGREFSPLVTVSDLNTDGSSFRISYIGS